MPAISSMNRYIPAAPMLAQPQHTIAFSQVAAVYQHAHHLQWQQQIEQCNQQRPLGPHYLPANWSTFNASAQGLAGIPRATMWQMLAIEIANENGGCYNGFAKQRYGQQGEHFLKQLRQLGEPGAQAACMEELIVDPGLMLRLPQFSQFMRKYPKLQTQSPWTAREAFSAYLGHLTLYRGLALSAEQLIHVRQHGLVASGFPGYQAEWADLLHAASQPLRHQLQQHLVAQQPSVLIATSKQFRTAQRYAHAKCKPEQLPVLLKITIPKLDSLPWQEGSYWPEGQQLQHTNLACDNDEVLIPFGIGQAELRYAHVNPSQSTSPLLTFWPNLAQLLCQRIYKVNSNAPTIPSLWQRLSLYLCTNYERLLGHFLADRMLKNHHAAKPADAPVVG